MRTSVICPCACMIFISFLACVEKEQVRPERIDPVNVTIRQTQSWTATASMTLARSRHTATLLENGNVLIAGGITGTLLNVQPTPTVEVYSPLTKSWNFADELHVSRSRHTATLLPDGRLLVVGGKTLGFTTRTAEIYVPEMDQWTLTANMHIAREYHTATLLPDGRVLVSGGLSFEEGLDNPAEKSAEIYDPVAEEWILVDPMHIARWGHAATLQSDGTVLVTGGTSPAGDGVYTVRAEIYDPADNQWYQVDGMSTHRGFHAAVLLANGKTLVAGGLTLPANQPHRNAITELFSDGDWLETGNMNVQRGNIRPSCTLLPDNRFIVSGGPGITTEIYEPITGVWNLTGNMTMARSNHTLTLLSTGQVLATGGENRDGFISAAEIYQP